MKSSIKQNINALNEKFKIENMHQIFSNLIKPKSNYKNEKRDLKYVVYIILELGLTETIYSLKL